MRAGTCAASSRDESHARRDGAAAGPMMSFVARCGVTAACAAAVALIACAAQAEPAPAAGNPTAPPAAPHVERKAAKATKSAKSEGGSDAINPYDTGGVIIRHR